MKSKSIKKLIIFFIIIILLIIVALIIINNKSKEENKEVIISNPSEEEKIDVEEVTSATAYFTVQSCVNKYIVYVNEKDSESVYKLLDKNYIQNNNITIDNILNKTYTLKEDSENSATFEATKMYVEELDENNNRYYVLGVLKTVEDVNDVKEKIIDDNFKIEVILDFENMIFSVAPLENGGIFNETNN